ncbi:M1 family metallopeptidase [Nocardioides sp. SYSU D00038]|uniref:M1 family metallopeptidase n=1 Tax=Nocardioides sp. SYSU D00038 TaxID=2812554 RepID=UPI0019676FDB|nr:M1 family metallopeptidase [Nocardioides sp. SYSU D00038]
MPVVPRPSVRPLALVAVVGAAVTLPLLGGASAPAAVERVPAPVVGSPGIGDAYFPLDGNGGIDVRRYRIHDRYDFRTGRLSGRTRITLTATTTLRRFNLDLLLGVDSVTVAGRPAAWRKPNRHELRIMPRRPLAAGRSVDVVVRYHGHPDRIAWQGERSWFADHAEVAAVNQPHIAPWWFPANDHPRDRAVVDVRITVPKDKRVISNGRLVSRRVHGRLATTRWRAAEPMAPYLAFFTAGSFQVASGRADGRPWYHAVSTRLPPSVRAGAMSQLRRTPEIVRWLEQRLGPYPFSTMGGVVSGVQTEFALENQTRPVYAPYATGTETVVHELAHQWFGDSVALHAWRDIWLNEGFATFMEWVWSETHGEGTADARLRAYHAGREPSAWAFRIGDPGPGRLFDNEVYTRGAATVQALRNRLGETDFWAVVRAWLAERRSSTGTTAQLRAVAERVSGQDLDAFFSAWLLSGKKPAATAAMGLG